MGLAPSREQYTGTSGLEATTVAGAVRGANTAPAEALLPFISRAPDGYTYEEETAPTAAAVEGGEMAEADGAAKKAPGKKGGKGKLGDADDANEIVYYYEHRLVPLTSEFFPSESSVLFDQLYAARAAQNARYHFQTTTMWSPGSLLDPTAYYQSLDALTDAACEEIQQAHVDATSTAASPQTASTASADVEVPFASRVSLYDLLVRTFEREGLLYPDNDALRAAWMPAVTASDSQKEKNKGKPAKAAPKGGTSTAAAASLPTASLRPLPCAIALVRVPITKAAYREVYYKAGFQRHHHMSKAGATVGPDAAAAVLKKKAQALESLKVIQVTALDVMRAVQAHDRQAPGTAKQSAGHTDTDTSSREWLSVQAPYESAERPVEMRIVGMFGCWTVEEILRYTLFVRSPDTASAATGGTAPPPWPLPPSAEAALARARPHGVPSSTLLKVTFFEKQVGDKEQCHTYFALLRYFARGLRDCFMQEASTLARPSALVSSKAAPAASKGVATTAADDAKAMQNILPLREDPHSAWDRFINYVVTAAERASLADEQAGGRASDVALPDWSTALLVRFSNVPQLQLCRQIRLLVHELVTLYPEPPTLLALQESQRRRNAALPGQKSVPQSASAAGSATVAANAGRKGKGKPEPLRTLLSDTEAANGAPKESPTPDQLLRRAPETPVSGQEDPSKPSTCMHQGSGNHSMGGLACYIQDGLVVMRLSHLQAARALQQLARMPLEDSVEAMAVTLTAPAPPQLTYRGELRLPAPLGFDSLSPQVPPDQRSVPFSVNACRYMLDEAANYPLYVPPGAASVFDEDTDAHFKEATPTGATRAVSLCDLPDEWIGVVPPTHAGLLPCPQPHHTPHSVSELDWMNLLAPFPYACTSPEVFAVPSALDGMPFRVLLERAREAAEAVFEWANQPSATTTHTQLGLLHPRRHPFLSALPGCGCVTDDGGASAEGKRGTLPGPDSLLLSPLRVDELPAPPSAPATTKTAIQLSPNVANQLTGWPEPRRAQSPPGSELPIAPPSQWFDLVELDEPDRILHTGDLIRCGPTSQSTRAKPSPSRTTPSSPTRLGTAASPARMRWFVDGELRMEDVILSWMRRLGSRARETRPAENRWVRYSPEQFQRLLWTEIRYRRPWLLLDATSTRRFPIPSGKSLSVAASLSSEKTTSSSCEAFPQNGLLISLLDIVKDRRFRQWRFALNGFVYFHGVSVRLPGITALPEGVTASVQAIEDAQSQPAPVREDGEGGGKRDKGKTVAGSAGAATTTAPSVRVDPNITCLRLFRLRDGSLAAVPVDDWMREGSPPDEVDPPVPEELPAVAPRPAPRSLAAASSTDLHRPAPLNSALTRTVAAPIPSPPTRPLRRAPSGTNSHSGSRTQTPLDGPYAQAYQEQSYLGAPVSTRQYPPRATGGSPYMGYTTTTTSTNTNVTSGGGGGTAQGEPMMTYGGSYYYYNGNYGESTAYPTNHAGFGNGSLPRHNTGSYGMMEFVSPTTGMMGTMDRSNSNSFGIEAMTPMSSVAGTDPARVTGSFFNEYPSAYGGAAGTSSMSALHPAGPSSDSVAGSQSLYQAGASSAPQTAAHRGTQPTSRSPPQQPRYPLTSQMTAMMPQVLATPARSIMPSTTGLQHHVWRDTTGGGAQAGQPVRSPQTTVKVRVLTRTRSGRSGPSSNSVNATPSVTYVGAGGNSEAVAAGTGHRHHPDDGSSSHGRPHPRARSGRGDALLYTESSTDQPSHDIVFGTPADGHQMQRQQSSRHSFYGGATGEMAAAPSGSELTYTGNSSAYGAMGLSRGGVEEQPEAPSEYTPAASHMTSAATATASPDMGASTTSHNAGSSHALLKRAASRGSNHGGTGSQSRGSWRSHNPYAYSTNPQAAADARSAASSPSLRSPATSFHGGPAQASSHHNAGSMIGGSSLYGTASGNDMASSLYETVGESGGGLYGVPSYHNYPAASGEAQGAYPDFADNVPTVPAPFQGGGGGYYQPTPASGVTSSYRPQHPPNTHADPRLLRGGNAGPFYMTSPPPQPVSVASPHSTPQTAFVGENTGSNGGSASNTRQTVVTFCNTGDSAAVATAPMPSSPAAATADAASHRYLLKAQCVQRRAIHATETSTRAAAFSAGEAGYSGAVPIPSTIVHGGSKATTASSSTNKPVSSPVPVPSAPTRNTILKKKS